MRRAIVRRRPAAFVVAVGAVSVAISALILYPLLQTVATIFFPMGHFDFAPIGLALKQSDLFILLRNTVLLVLASTTIALVIGSLFAWLTERTDVGMAWLARTLPIMPLLVPPIAGAIGWVLLTAPRSGFLNVLLRAALARLGLQLSEGPLTIFSWPGLLFVYVCGSAWKIDPLRG